MDIECKILENDILRVTVV